MKRLVVIGGRHDRFKEVCRELGRKPKDSIHCRRSMDLRRLDLCHSKVVTVAWPGASTLDLLEKEAMLNDLYFRGVEWSHVQ